MQNFSKLINFRKIYPLLQVPCVIGVLLVHELASDDTQASPPLTSLPPTVKAERSTATKEGGDPSLNYSVSEGNTLK